MDCFKITILLFAISGVVIAAPKDVKKSEIISSSESTAVKDSVVEAKPLASTLSLVEKSKPIVEPEADEKLETSDSLGLGYYLPYSAPLIKYNHHLPVYTYLNYVPGFYHSYRNHGFGAYGGYGFGDFGYNYGVYH